MSYYIIRHKDSKKYLPCCNTKHKAKTWLELTDSLPPRLFMKLHHAQDALRWWLKGKWFYYYFHGNFHELQDEGIDVKRDPTRKADEMEIVEVELLLH